MKFAKTSAKTSTLRSATTAMLFAGLIVGLSATPNAAQQRPIPAEAPTGNVPPQQAPDESRFSPNELVDAGHRFFGGVSRGLAMVVEKAVSQWGLPNGYVLGEEAGVDGSAYFIGGFGMTALTANNIVLVPIRSGVGLRLGANLGYLKFTSHPTWNPF